MVDYESIYTGAQLDDKLTGVFGELHTHDNSTAQAFASGATYVKIVNWTNVGIFKNTTTSVANSNIVINKSGKFRIEGSFSFSSGTNNSVVFISLFVNDVEKDSIHLTRKISTAGDVGNANFSGLITLSEGDIIDVRVRHDNVSSVNLTFSYSNFNCSRIEI